MRYGIEVVPFGEYAEPMPVVELAVAAEAAGWDAVCLWDHATFPGGVGDPWVTLAAVAARTERIRLITGVSPIPRYRPHLLARSLHALDALSRGRVTLGAGIGVAPDAAAVGDVTDPRARAEITDEALDLIRRWCDGETVTHAGEHVQVTDVQIGTRGFQHPHVPVWIGGASRPALRRAARWDGWIIGTIDENQRVTVAPEQVAEHRAYLDAHRGGRPLDVAVDGVTAAGDAGLSVEYAEAGATWWLESLFGLRGSHAEMLERVSAGPPQ